MPLTPRQATAATRCSSAVWWGKTAAFWPWISNPAPSKTPPLFCGKTAYAAEESADTVVFNFGWLPAGDQSIFTRKETSIPAVEAGLRLLRPGGAMSLCIYYGRDNGYDERDALLQYVRSLDDRAYSVMVIDFANRKNDPPIFVWIVKEG